MREKFFSIICAFSLLINSLLPIFSVGAVYAEDSTVSATVASPSPAASEAPSPSIEPTDAPTTLPSPDPTPTPIISPSPEISPEPIVSTTPSTEPENTPSPTPDENIGQANAPPGESPSPAPTPEPSPSASADVEQAPTGQIFATILENTDAETLELDLSTQNDVSSATLTTDKADYAPTDTVVVSGSDFLPDTEYTLIISSSDEPAVNFEAQVSTNEQGSFLYSYQLDGNYRPNYLVELKDSSGDVVATVTFTDANPNGNPSADLDQCANDPAPSSSTDGCNTNANEWVNGNLGASKSSYFEEDSIPYRLKFDNLSLSSHAVTIEWDTTKSDKHAIDYLTTFNRTVATADPCLGVSGCGSSTTFAIPPDPQVTGAGVTPVAGDFTLYGGTITGVSAYFYPNGTGFAGDKSARITITFTASVANPVLAWGGHIAARGDWGNEMAAVAIPGSPYHTRLIDLDGSGGNQDHSLSAEAVIFPASITIIKDAVPDNAQDFGYSTTGGLTPASFNLDDDSDGTLSNNKLFSGLLVTGNNGNDYTITEDLLSGWVLSFDTPVCTVTSANGGTQSGDTGTGTISINLQEGENVSCTFINNLQQANLTLVKTVTNDNGGSAAATDWTLSASGPTPISGTTGSVSVTNATVNAGTYTLSESGGPSGYTGGTYSCVNNGGSAVVSNSITLAPGDNATCTINNDDDAARLIIIKQVTNNNGGTKVAGDFSGSISGVTVSGGNTWTGTVSPGVDKTLTSVGSYSVTETADPDYDTTYSTDCTGTIALGQTKTCTVTNNDKAANLIVIKRVVNDNGGTKTSSDFTMHINGTSVGVGVSFAGADNPGINTPVNAGTFSVTEDSVTGYTSSTSGDCTGSIALGQTKTCTITNDDNAPSLTLVKTVTKDNGGTASDTDWMLTATGTGGSPTNLSGTTPVTSGTNFKADTYTLGENSGPSGYVASQYSCVKNGGDAVLGNSITLGLGDSATCTINNNDIGPTLKLVKNVVKDNGGTAVAHDWTLTATGVEGFSDFGDSTVFHPVKAGIGYVLSESTVPGYDGGSWSCDGGSLSDSTVTLGLNQNVTCIITNNDQVPALHLRKTVTKDNGGTALETAWTLTATGTGGSPTNLSGTTPVDSGSNFKADIYALAESGGPTGYTAGAWDCGNATMPDATHVTVPLGGDVTCTINNNDNVPSLTLQKIVVNDNGGTKVASDWSLYASMGNVGIGGIGPTVSSDSTFSAGTYILSETGPSGYNSPSGWICVGGTQEGDSITLGLGQSATCTITNNDDAPSLTLNKVVVNDNGGSALESAWILTAEGPTTISGPGAAGSTDVTSDSLFDQGTYTLSESAGPSGYSPSTWSCTNDVTVNGNNQITLGLGQSTVCTITNNDQAGQIKIVKNTVGGDDTFGFTVAGPTSSTPNVTTTSGTGDTGLLTVNSGSYSISETTIPDGWDKTGASCDSGTPASFTVTNGGTVTCTFTNTKKGHLIVQKTTLPALDPTEFSITATGSGIITGGGAGTISDTQDKDYEVTPGTYSVTETIPSGWDKTGDTCQNVAVAAGETKTCEITNTKHGHIIIVKDAIPNNAQDFTFNNNFELGNPVTVTLDDDGNNGNGFANSYDATVTAGTYSVTEDGVAGWKLSSTSCSDGSPVSNIDVLPGETVTCTFVNKKLGSIILNKNTVGGDGTFDFVMTGQSLPGSAQLTTISSSATQTFNDIDPENTYSINETVPTGWDLTDTSCVNENGVTKDNSSFTINNGGTVTCTFENTKKGSITIIKDAIPDDSQNFSYSTTGSGLTNFDLDDESDETLSNTKTFNNLELGSYSVTENSADGWDLTNISCNTGEETNLETGTVSITLSPGENVICTFTNTKKGHLIVQKITIPGGEPDLFTIQAAGSGTINGSTSPYISDGLGIDSTYTVTPGTYSVTEDPLEGWDETNNGCQGIVVAAGKDETCTITNTKRGEIIIDKQTDPDGAEQTFEFESDYDDNFFLSDGESNPSGLLEPGIYSVSELTPQDWSSTSVCSDGSGSESISLDPAEIVTCIFTNTRNTGSVQVNKEVDSDGDGTFEGGNDEANNLGFRWSIDAGDNNNEMGTSKDVVTGPYMIGENIGAISGYHFVGWFFTGNEGSCDDEESLEGTVFPVNITVSTDETTEVTLCNARDTGTITILKNIDNNEDGDTDDEEDVRGAEDWTWNILDGDQDIATGQTKTLATGTYTISEDQKSGYELLGWSCSENGEIIQTGETNSIAVNVAKDSDITCTFTNQFLPPVLTLTKANNRTGIDVSAGADVLYTLTVTLTGSPLSNVSLIDLPPAGFKYRSGSWTAVSSERGDLKPAITTEPTYASPGTWSLGNMVTGETVTLTYIADIDTSTDPGLYKDLAWSSGEGQTSSTVLANENNGFFVGTEVNVVAGSGDSAGVNVVREERGEVLGVSTELPQTGINTLWSILAVLLLASGAGLIFAGISLRRKYE